jgi:hypothetical protein
LGRRVPRVEHNGVVRVLNRNRLSVLYELNPTHQRLARQAANLVEHETPLPFSKIQIK